VKADATDQPVRNDHVVGVIKGEPPVVSVNPTGLHTLELTSSLREAITKFQQANPNMDMADCGPLKYTDEECTQTYKEWCDIATFAKASVQYPFVCVGRL